MALHSTQAFQVFKALYLAKDGEKFAASVTQVDEKALPEGDVTLRVEHSTINYKDALAIANASPIVRKWPMVAGIDGAGTVEESRNPRWKPGDKVILNGWGVGENHWGCLAQKARLKGDWLVRLPKGMTTRQAMAIGTAGYTAMLAVMDLERLGATKERGEALVTGATGGVGSIAVALLAKRGYRVAASTGKLGEAGYLRALGATEIIDRKTLSEPGKPLQKERWGSVIDSVGSTRSPTPARRPPPRASSPPAGSRRAWTFRSPSRPSSCVASPCAGSIASMRFASIVSGPGITSHASSTPGFSNP